MITLQLNGHKPVGVFRISISAAETEPKEVSKVTKSVLIVDDSAFVRKALCETFRREDDLDVCGEAENGRDAIEKARQLHPDLIVLDLSMPVMNGLDAARVLRRLMPSVPLIMYSAFGDRYLEEQARLIGISSLISKSEPVAALIGQARNLLSAPASSSPFEVFRG
jgi:two-component system chemotaxis response regulator CheY